MNPKATLTALLTISRREVNRFLRIWTQSLVPPVITTSLYFIIFGSFIGSQLPDVNGFSYMQFIVPGLVMMTLITSSFSNVVGSFFLSRFQRSVEEMLVAPMPYWVIIAGYTIGGVLRGLLVGLLVLLVSLLFSPIHIFNIGIVILFAVLCSLLFSLGGLINGVFAKNFDSMMIVPTFILTPLTYLGGIFYSINALPPFWRSVSQFNPMLYMINGFRYGFLGITDVSIWISLAIITLLTILAFFYAIHLFKKGIRLKV